jgi:hypothetical protein
MVIQGINLRHLPHQCSLSTRQKKLLKQALEYGIRGYSPVPPTSTQKIYIADAVKALYRNLSMGPQLSVSCLFDRSLKGFVVVSPVVPFRTLKVDHMISVICLLRRS